MKTKSFLNFAVCLLLSAAFLIACNSDSRKSSSSKSSISMDNAKTMEKLQKYYKELNLDDFKVTGVHWIENDKMSNEAGIAVFYLLKSNGNTYSQSYLMYGPTEGIGSLSDSKSRTKYVYENVNNLSPNEFAADKVLGYYEAAKLQIPEGYTYQGISQHDFGTDEKTNKRTQSFKLMVTEDGNEEIKSGGQTMIEYYEISFEVAEDGSVVMKD